MKSDRGSNLMNPLMAVVLIVIGFVAEPLVGVLGALIIITSVVAQLVEDYRKGKNLIGKEEQYAVYADSMQHIGTSIAK